MDQSGTAAGTGVTFERMNAPPLPSAIPMSPPITVTVIDSIRNCQRISRRVAPSALRTPISRVRSVTEIIMIATTPTPPTIRPMEESTSMMRKKAPVMRLKRSRKASCRTSAKLFSSAGLSPRATRMATRTSSIACCCVAPAAGTTRRSSQSRLASSRLMAVVGGTMAQTSASLWKRFGCIRYTPETVNISPLILTFFPVASAPGKSTSARPFEITTVVAERSSSDGRKLWPEMNSPCA